MPSCKQTIRQSKQQCPHSLSIRYLTEVYVHCERSPTARDQPQRFILEVSSVSEWNRVVPAFPRREIDLLVITCPQSRAALEPASGWHYQKVKELAKLIKLCETCPRAKRDIAVAKPLVGKLDTPGIPNDKASLDTIDTLLTCEAY